MNDGALCTAVDKLSERQNWPNSRRLIMRLLLGYYDTQGARQVDASYHSRIFHPVLRKYLEQWIMDKTSGGGQDFWATIINQIVTAPTDMPLHAYSDAVGLNYFNEKKKGTAMHSLKHCMGDTFPEGWKMDASYARDPEQMQNAIEHPSSQCSPKYGTRSYDPNGQPWEDDDGNRLERAFPVLGGAVLLTGGYLMCPPPGADETDSKKNPVYKFTEETHNMMGPSGFTTTSA